MRKSLPFLTLAAALLIGGAATAQNQRTITPVQGKIGKPVLESATSTEAVTCGPDALDYVSSKVDTIGADSLFYFEIWPAEKTSTAYANTQSVTIEGVFVYGKVATGDPGPADMQVSVWNVNGAWEPTTMISGATASLSIAAAANPMYHYFTFATPVTVTDSFAIVLTNNDASDYFWAVGSDGDPANPNLLEGLTYYDWQGFWEPVSAVYAGIGEGLVIPAVTYSVSTSFTANNTVCVGTPLSFTNTSSALYGNRFFNLHAFSQNFLGETDSTFVWNFGDASGNMYMSSGSHTYNTPGTYTVSLTGTMLGYLDTCSETATMQITVLGPAASFTTDLSLEPMVTFTNTSTTVGASPTYMWDFGDASTSTLEDPVHTYAASGTYTVTLTVNDSCGSATTTQVVTITSVGINEMASVNVKAFYNAGGQVLNVSLPGSANATVEVYNVVGAMIYSEAGVNASSKAISLGGLTEGTYLVRVRTSNGAGVAKFVVIR